MKNDLDNDREPSIETIMNLILELKVSRLLAPAVEDEDSYAFEHVESEEDGLKYLPLFTCAEEYEKHAVEGSEYDGLAFDFEAYCDLVLESELDGIIIDMEGEFLPLEREFLNDIKVDFDIEIEEDYDEYEPDELKNIFENITNQSLVRFINGDGSDDIEKLYVELSDSTLLNLVVSDTPLDEFAKDGIIYADDVDGFNLCALEDEDIRLGAVFTDKEALLKAADDDSGLCYYGQVTVLSKLFDFILRNDMEGVVINPGSDDYIIARSDILPQASGIEIIVENPEFENSLEYAFLL